LVRGRWWGTFWRLLVVLGSSLLLILPGIYFGIALYFSQLILIDQGTRGTQALGASRALVRGRWWGTFWRLLAGGIVFGLLTGLATAIAVWIVASIANTQAFTGGQASTDPLVQGILQLVQMVVVAAFMPLMTGFQVKLYRALQKTR
jgi:hypothetical protein